MLGKLGPESTKSGPPRNQPNLARHRHRNLTELVRHGPLFGRSGPKVCRNLAESCPISAEIGCGRVGPS